MNLIRFFWMKRVETYPDRPHRKNNSLSEGAILSKAKKRNNLNYYNQLISECAKRKDIELGRKLFDQLNQQGRKPDVYTYTSLINVYIRVGDIENAHSLFEDMKKNQVQPNEVTYTILIKGYTDNTYEIQKACELLKEMQDFVKPNLRTYNTILRGCVRTGEHEIGSSIHQAMIDQGLTEDVSSLGALFQLKLQEWKIKEANQLLVKLDQLSPPNYNFIVDLAAVAALAGDKKMAKQKLDKTQGKQLSQHLQLRIESINKYCSIPITPRPHPKESNQVHFLPSKEPLTISQLKMAHPDQPLNLEIGSGYGEWIIDRCNTVKNENWVALEIRYDRIHSSYSNMVLNNTNNLVLLCGDAQDSLKSSVPPNSFSTIYINFPEPNLNEKYQLFTIEFISHLYRALIPNGQIKIITDDKPYLDLVLANFKEFIRTSPLTLTVEEATNNKLYNTFFDELWKKKGRSSRHLLIVTKD